MFAEVDLQQMPLPEKLALFETLWAELSSEPEQVEIPQWHKDILDARLEAADRGEVEVIDWEVAKNQIRDMVR
ncbi:MAG: addiction module protein [Blastochloris sp.]|nr:addiction module protein [Blastochloris sp.]